MTGNNRWARVIAERERRPFGDAEFTSARTMQRFSFAGQEAAITLSVLGRVELTLPDPFAPKVMAAFDAHQRRDTAEGQLLGPDAAHAAVRALYSASPHCSRPPKPLAPRSQYIRAGC